MPQAPGLTPTAVPSGFAPEVNLPVPVDAFGGAVGHALEGLGGQIEQSSDRIWGRAVEMQGLQNETEAKEADAKYMMQSGLMHADFINKEGLNAGPEALQKHIQELQDLRTSIRGSLSNPAAQRMYDASSLGFMGRNIFNAAGHSGQQMKVASNNASAARKDMVKSNIGDNPEDDVSFQRGIQTIKSENRRIASNSGWTPEQEEATNQADISETVGHRILGTARLNAPKAQRMLDSAIESGAIKAADAERLQATVQTQFRQQGSRFISDKVLADRRAGEEDDKTEQDYINAGLEEAKKYSSKDPLFPDFVRERIMGDYRRQKGIERDDNQAAEQTVASAMMNGNKEGVLPKSVDELRLIDPNVGPAWDRLQPTTQRKYMHEMATNALGNRVTWNDENLATYKGIKGQAADDPTAFLARDIVSEKIPASAKRELINLQQRMTKQSQQDPRVMRAMTSLGPDLNAAGISKAKDAESYYQFVGGLQDALEDFQSRNPGKPPNLEDIRTIGARLMQEQLTGRRGWLLFTSETQPLYKLPVSDEDDKRIRGLDIWSRRGIAEPTDAMVQRYYHAEKYKELYGGSAKKTEPK